MYKLQKMDYQLCYNISLNYNSMSMWYQKCKLFYLILHIVLNHLMELYRQLNLQSSKIYIFDCHFQISCKLHYLYQSRQRMKYLKRLPSKLIHSIDMLTTYYLCTTFSSNNFRKMHKLYHKPYIYCNTNQNRIFGFVYNFSNRLCLQLYQCRIMVKYHQRSYKFYLLVHIDKDHFLL